METVFVSSTAAPQSFQPSETHQGTSSRLRRCSLPTDTQPTQLLSRSQYSHPDPDMRGRKRRLSDCFKSTHYNHTKRAKPTTSLTSNFEIPTEGDLALWEKIGNGSKSMKIPAFLSMLSRIQGNPNTWNANILDGEDALISLSSKLLEKTIAASGKSSTLSWNFSDSDFDSCVVLLRRLPDSKSLIERIKTQHPELLADFCMALSEELKKNPTIVSIPPIESAEILWQWAQNCGDIKAKATATTLYLFSIANIKPQLLPKVIQELYLPLPKNDRQELLLSVSHLFFATQNSQDLMLEYNDPVLCLMYPLIFCEPDEKMKEAFWDLPVNSCEPSRPMKVGTAVCDAVASAFYTAMESGTEVREAWEDSVLPNIEFLKANGLFSGSNTHLKHYLSSAVDSLYFFDRIHAQKQLTDYIDNS